MTLLVRDEADIVAEHLEYHIGAGADYVIATDHRSQDGTTEILASYERAGVLRLIREGGEFARQSEWQTRMARLAVTDHGADWVINSDADEFWWPRGPSLKQVLSEIPSRYGVVRGLVRNFVPMRRESGRFAERMTVRLAWAAPINDPATPFRPVVKVAHRGSGDVSLGKGGGHHVFGVPGSLLDSWYPLEVLHIPLRSREQCAQKYRKTLTGWEVNLRGDLARARRASNEGSGDPVWERVALDDVEIERGLRAGSLVTDTRLRDALRALREGRGVGGTHSDRSERDTHALDVSVFEEAEAVRLQRWLDDIERRAVALMDGASSCVPSLRSR